MEDIKITFIFSKMDFRYKMFRPHLNIALAVQRFHE
jgi:hypothetical protein